MDKCCLPADEHDRIRAALSAFDAALAAPDSPEIDATSEDSAEEQEEEEASNSTGQSGGKRGGKTKRSRAKGSCGGQGRNSSQGSDCGSRKRHAPEGPYLDAGSVELAVKMHDAHTGPLYAFMERAILQRGSETKSPVNPPSALSWTSGQVAVWVSGLGKAYEAHANAFLEQGGLNVPTSFMLCSNRCKR